VSPAIQQAEYKAPLNTTHATVSKKSHPEIRRASRPNVAHAVGVPERAGKCCCSSMAERRGGMVFFRVVILPLPVEKDPKNHGRFSPVTLSKRYRPPYSSARRPVVPPRTIFR